MGFVVFVIIFSVVVIAALIAVFIIFVVKGRQGAKKDQSLYEKGLITKDQYESGFNQATRDMVAQNYEEFRKQEAANRRAQKNNRQ